MLTGRTMPREVPENDLLIAELARLGVKAELLPWDEPLEVFQAPLTVVCTTWDYWARLDEFLDALGRLTQRTDLLNPVELIRWNCHKGYLLELAEAGVLVIPTRLVPRGAAGEQQAAALASLGDAEAVIKPTVSAGARGALRTPASDPAASAHLAELTARGDALVQPLAASVLTRGEISLIFFGGEFSHAVRKVPAAGEYRIQLKHGGSVLPYRPTDAELAVAAAALAAAPTSTSHARVDLVELPEGPAVMELELIEPELFLTVEPAPLSRYARHLAGRLSG
jgi:glutathione synthase/RimK-type ligase-like ATP-grasp enzyme